jgi:hypothetical protein
MKIYIANMNINNIKKNIEKLDNYCINKQGTIIYELYSNDSEIYIIEESKIYKIENINENYELLKSYNNYDLLIDYTSNSKKELLSQLPLNYILTKITRYEFKINKKSNLSLIIEYKLDLANNDLYDFYFIYNEKKIDMKNMFFQEEFNMFLFYLN